MSGRIKGDKGLGNSLPKALHFKQVQMMKGMDGIALLNGLPTLQRPPSKGIPIKTKLPIYNSRIHLVSHFRKHCCISNGRNYRKNVGFVVIKTVNYEIDDDDDVQQENGSSSSTGSMDWEPEFLAEIDPYGHLPPKKRKKEPRSTFLQETNKMEWCMRARKIALKSIEARGLTDKMERVASGDQRKKKSPKESKVDKLIPFGFKIEEVDTDFDSDGVDFDMRGWKNVTGGAWAVVGRWS